MSIVDNRDIGRSHVFGSPQIRGGMGVASDLHLYCFIAAEADASVEKLASAREPWVDAQGAAVGASFFASVVDNAVFEEVSDAS